MWLSVVLVLVVRWCVIVCTIYIHLSWGNMVPRTAGIRIVGAAPVVAIWPAAAIALGIRTSRTWGIADIYKFVYEPVRRANHVNNYLPVCR